jgi:hypothetical protein
MKKISKKEIQENLEKNLVDELKKERPKYCFKCLMEGVAVICPFKKFLYENENLQKITNISSKNRILAKFHFKEKKGIIEKESYEYDSVCEKIKRFKNKKEKKIRELKEKTNPPHYSPGWSVSVSGSLHGIPSYIAAAKRLGIPLYNPQGEYNGYGYERLPLHIDIDDKHERIKAYLHIKKESDRAKKEKAEKEAKKNSSGKPILSYVDKWAARLAKLTGITIDEAKDIAEEKLNSKEEDIDAMEDRQCDRYSIQRQKLINKMRRTNPLRRIEDESHAYAILAASDRHNNTDYEEKLEEGRELRAMGEIEDAKEYARQNYTKNY